MPSHQIDIIPSYQIDKVKWDKCIDRSANSLIYAHSYYLDHLADNWHGIIINDYDCVMPVPWRKKFGIRYCYDVPFIQQLGYFGEANKIQAQAIVEALCSFVKYGDAKFNYQNKSIAEFYKTNTATNLIIDLSQDYSAIRIKYNKGLINNLKKAEKENLIFFKNAEIKDTIELYQSTYEKKIENVSKADYKNFFDLCNYLQPKGQCLVYKIINDKDRMMASTLFLKDDHRIYNIINTTTNEGRETSSNHFLIDCIIKKFAGSNMIFDFEGSSIPGIQTFYKKFGAINQPYFWLKINNLPFPINLIKD